jgi:hypothetical protein
MAQNPMRRLWVFEDDGSFTYEQVRNSEGTSDLEEDTVYRLQATCGSRRGWINKENGTRHWELCVTGPTP